MIFNDSMSWILAAIEFLLIQLLRDRNWDALEMLANNFAEKNDGIFYGLFGAMDGLAVRI